MLLRTRVRSRCRPSWRRFVGEAFCATSNLRELVLDEIGIFQKLHGFVPNDLIEQLLANRWVIANCAFEMPPSVRAKTAVVVNLARARACRCSVERITTFATC